MSIFRSFGEAVDDDVHWMPLKVSSVSSRRYVGVPVVVYVNSDCGVGSLRSWRMVTIGLMLVALPLEPSPIPPVPFV